MSKLVQHGALERPSKILVSLEDFTSLRGEELLQGIYFIVFGYAMEGGVLVYPPETERIDMTMKLRDDDIREEDSHVNVQDYFFGWRCNLKLAQKGRVFHFPNGIPLYYGRPVHKASVYIAALDAGSLDPKTLVAFWHKTINGKGKPYFENKVALEAPMVSAVKALQKINETLAQVSTPPNETKMTTKNREAEITENYSTVKKAFSLLIKILKQGP